MNSMSPEESDSPNDMQNNDARQELQPAVVIEQNIAAQGRRGQVGGRRNNRRSDGVAHPFDLAAVRQNMSAIRASRVSQNSRAAYTSSIVRFLQFLYQNMQAVLTDEFKEKIQMEMEGDPPLPSRKRIREVLLENSVEWTG